MNITSPRGAKIWFIKIYMVQSWLKLTSSKENLECWSRGAGRKELRTVYRWSIILSLRKSAPWEGFTMFHAPGSGHAGPGVVQKQPNKYVKWSQVACTSKHMRTWSSVVIQSGTQTSSGENRIRIKLESKKVKGLN